MHKHTYINIIPQYIFTCYFENYLYLHFNVILYTQTDKRLERAQLSDSTVAIKAAASLLLNENEWRHAKMSPSLVTLSLSLSLSGVCSALWTNAMFATVKAFKILRPDLVIWLMQT